MYQPKPGKVLLIVSNHDECRFHSLFCIPEGKTEPVHYTAGRHLGMSRDSFVIVSDSYEINIGYFPENEKLVFYRIETNGMPLMIENTGNAAIKCSFREYDITLAPGERKMMVKGDMDGQ